MKLDYIKINNFRQFKDIKLEFSKDPKKNITIIMGNNGAGKTTLAQAFFWCFYGETSFKSKDLLNSEELEKLKIGEKLKVKVEISFEYDQIIYFAVRETEYVKKNINKISNVETRESLLRKKENGEMESINFAREIRRIFPKELSKYFFFDGERIEKMSKDIQDETQAKDFAEAVKGLLGLNGMISAIGHLKGINNRKSVIKQYNDRISLTDDEEIAEESKKLNNCIEILENIEEKLKSLDYEKNENQKQRDNIIRELQTYELSKNLQKEKEEYENKVKLKLEKQEEKIGNSFKLFRTKGREFFCEEMIKGALKELKEYKTKEVIPGLNRKLLEFLIEQNKCICGKEIKKDSNEYKNIKLLLEDLTSNPINNDILYFKENSENRLKKVTDFYEEMKIYNKDILELEDEISDLNQKIYDIDEKFSDKNLGEKINNLNNSKRMIEKFLLEKDEEKKSLLEEKGKKEVQKEELEKNLKIISEKNKESKQLILYKDYAEAIYNYLCRNLEEKESEVRKELEEEINQIFKDIFSGELKLEIGEKYNVYVTSKSREIETSTAQSIAVIFAFISGIIKLARKYKKGKNGISEPYPLVMDAPLSAFDKHRINTICKVLPEIAEQVIIFIKDTDGDIAKNNLESRLGKNYILNKVSVGYTTI